MLSPPAIIGFAVFLAVMGAIEWAVAAWQGKTVHRGPDTVNDLVNALGHFVFGAVVRVSPVLAYAWLDEQIPNGITLDRKWLWLAAPLALDFLFYWRHRAMHRIALLWAFHSVHHQSNQFNFVVALRIGWFQDLTSWPFLLPLAVLGVPVEVTIAIAAIDHAYQFLLHTEVVGKIPFLEGIVATPSSHRVHHACNARYIDKNYAGMFAFWDRLMGTYEPETEPVVYGTTKSIASFDPIENNVGPVVELFARAGAAATWWDALRIVFGPPGWAPETGEPAPGQPGVRVVPPGRAGRAVTVVSVATVVLTFTYLAMAEGMAPVARMGIGIAILVGLWAIPAWMRSRQAPAVQPLDARVPACGSVAA